MLENMDRLEANLMQLLARHQTMRAENLRLRQEAVALENANKLLQERLAEARERAERLYNTLPD